SFGPLLGGVPTAVFPDDSITDPGRLVEMLEQHRVTRIALMPSVMRVVLDMLAATGRDLPRLRYWHASNEPVTAELLNRFRQQNPQATMLNLYGSTEVTGDVTCFAPGGPAETDGPLPAGRPISNVRAYILDRGLRPVPVGTPGDVYIGGAAL